MALETTTVTQPIAASVKLIFYNEQLCDKQQPFY